MVGIDGEIPESFHADLGDAIAVALACGGPPEDEADAALDVLDVLVVRGVIPPPYGYHVVDGRVVEQ